MKDKKALIFCITVAMIILITAMVGCSESSALKKAEYDTVKQTKMDNFTLMNDFAQEGQIVMCGDSIVEIYSSELLNNFPSSNPRVVYNRGISGDSTIGLKKRFKDNVLKIKPSIVSILIGTNDLSFGLTLETVSNNIIEMIEMAKANGVAKVIVQSMYPVNFNINASMVGARKNSDIAKWNERFREVCATKDAIYADVNSRLQDKDGNFNAAYTYDRLHPNALGYIEITKILEPYFI